MRDYDAIVIGSGAGGLTAAVALARAGKRVVVFEQHYLPGGWCHSFSLEGYRFSPGVHYIGELGPGGFMRNIYEGLGVARDLVFLELNPDGYDHVRLGETTFDIPKGKDEYARRLIDRFPAEAKGIVGYLDSVERMARSLNAAFDVSSWGAAAKAAWRARELLVHGFRPLSSYLSRFISDPVLKGILTIQAGDHGVPPKRAVTALHASVAAHYFGGAWYPMGGARSIPRAFIRELRRNGGELKVRTGVERILVEGRGSARRAIGVRLQDGTEVRAPLVISNADPEMTFGTLVDESHVDPKVRRKLTRSKWSLTGLSLFLAVDMDVRAAGLDSGNFWYSETPDIDAMYAAGNAADPSRSGQFPGSFLTCTTLKDPTESKQGHHTLEAFTFGDWDNFERWEHTQYEARPDDYEAFKARLEDKMFKTLEHTLPGIRDAVVFKSLGTPLTAKHYVESHRGNFYGTEKTWRHVGPFAWPVKTPISGLLMCGASTVGHGVAGATISGLVAAQTALGCSKRDLVTSGGPTLRTYSAEQPESWLDAARKTRRRGSPERSAEAA